MYLCLYLISNHKNLAHNCKLVSVRWFTLESLVSCSCGHLVEGNADVEGIDLLEAGGLTHQVS